MVFKLKKKVRPLRELNYSWKPILTDNMYKEDILLNKLFGTGKITYERIEKALDENPDLEDLESRLLDYVYSDVERKINTIGNGMEYIANALMDENVSQKVKDDIVNDLGVLVDFGKDFERIYDIDPEKYIPDNIEPMNRKLYEKVNNIVHEYTSTINDYIKDHGDYGVDEFEVVPEGYDNSEPSIEDEYEAYEFYEMQPEEQELEINYDQDLVE